MSGEDFFHFVFRPRVLHLAIRIYLMHIHIMYHAFLYTLRVLYPRRWQPVKQYRREIVVFTAHTGIVHMVYRSTSTRWVHLQNTYLHTIQKLHTSPKLEKHQGKPYIKPVYRDDLFFSGLNEGRKGSIAPPTVQKKKKKDENKEVRPPPPEARPRLPTFALFIMQFDEPFCTCKHM